MHEQLKKTKESKNQLNSVAGSQRQSNNHFTSLLMDNRSEAIQMQKLQQLADNSHKINQLISIQDILNTPQTKEVSQLQTMEYNNTLQKQQQMLIPTNWKSSNTIQKYSYKAYPTKITAQLPNNTTQEWIESTRAEVSWQQGEIMDPNNQGSHDVHNNNWVGLLKNQSNNNNATGLHVVNANWGGSANALEGNLVPGTPSLNGHHKAIENQVHNQFKNNGGQAPENMSYEADIVRPYPQTIDLRQNNSGDVILYNDPTITCTVNVGSNTLVNNEQVALGGGTKIIVP